MYMFKCCHIGDFLVSVLPYVYKIFLVVAKTTGVIIFKTCLECSSTQMKKAKEKYALTNYKCYIGTYISFMYN